jgi:hypothetical protein
MSVFDEQDSQTVRLMGYGFAGIMVLTACLIGLALLVTG